MPSLVDVGEMMLGSLDTRFTKLIGEPGCVALSGPAAPGMQAQISAVPLMGKRSRPRAPKRSHGSDKDSRRPAAGSCGLLCGENPPQSSPSLRPGAPGTLPPGVPASWPEIARMSASVIVPSQSTSNAMKALSTSQWGTCNLPEQTRAARNSQKCSRPSPVKSKADNKSLHRFGMSARLASFAASSASALGAISDDKPSCRSMSGLQSCIQWRTSSSTYTTPLGVALFGPSKRKKMSRNSVHTWGDKKILSARCPHMKPKILLSCILTAARSNSFTKGVKGGFRFKVTWGMFSQGCACTSAAVNLLRGSRSKHFVMRSMHSGETPFHRLPENGDFNSLAFSAGAAISHKMSCSSSALKGARPLMSM
mmetsp:Transcript_81279/g.235696  ORF Transcript_81279/g.235696 Transcript_81279/m.235696 type:complete len:366 (+) Transcript_81279:248-1345(+)